MKKTMFSMFLFAIVVTLSSCGGGGGSSSTGSNNPTSPPPNGFNLTVTPLVSSLPANTLGLPIFLGSPFLTQLEVNVVFANGQIAPDGTTVNLQTNNASVAFISLGDDLATALSAANSGTVGGKANFFINSLSEGSATFTAAASTGGRSYTANVVFNVTPGPIPIEQLSVVTPRTSLPVNDLEIPFFSGTPFMLQADIQFRDVFGNFTNPDIGTSASSSVEANIAPLSTAYFTTLDDADTEDINEFLLPLGSGNIDMVAGHGSIFIWSRAIPGVATISLSAIEVGSGSRHNASFSIEVIDGATDIQFPSTVAVTSSGSLYINGSGGSTSQSLNINVQSGNAPVQDPQVNNIMISIQTDGPNSGEKLTGINITGDSVQGTSIKIASVNGIANALINSGTNSNTILATITVDRADNNVDNGIQDALTTNETFVVSDGILWALEITNASLDVLTVNGDTNVDGSDITYNFQDGTYSFDLSAIGTDKGGNPALPQTVQFGMINSPIVGYPENGSGSFVISSFDGDPQEGGSTFTSVSGGFLTAAGGVQPTDTLLVFAEESLGNEDLESAVSVASVNSQTNLTIVERFNRNDETGSINNDFGIFPYAIGRAVDGNINATATINELGVASTKLNYPVSQLGKLAAIYVKGQGPINNNTVKSITDVELMAFPGVEGFNGQSSTLTVSPSIIPANRSFGFVVCLNDSARNPLPARFVSFSYTGSVGQGSIDGISGSGVMNNPTGLNGCTQGIASTFGITSGASNLGFNFSSGGLTCDLEGSTNTNCIDVISSENGILNANPSSFSGRGTVDIILSLYDGSGLPIEGVPLSGSCSQVEGILSIISGPTVTDSNGQSAVRITVGIDSPGGRQTGSCNFATPSGTPSTTVNFSGGDSCALINPSPTPPPGACDMEEFFSVGGSVIGLTANSTLVLQNNGGDSRSITSDGAFLFSSQVSGSVYLITVASQPQGLTCTVANAIGTVTSNVTNVEVSCAP